MQKWVSPTWCYFNGDSRFHALAYALERYNKQQSGQILDWLNLRNEKLKAPEIFLLGSVAERLQQKASDSVA